MRVYDASKNQLVARYQHGAGVLCCCFGDQGHVLSGGIDRAVLEHDLATGQTTVLGSHERPVRGIGHTAVGYAHPDLTVTGGWDRTVRFWDRRARGCVATSAVGGKVFSLSAVGPRVVAALSGRRVALWDLVRDLAAPAAERESSLKYQSRAVRIFPDATGYALASIEGRVAVEYFDASPAVQARRYAFKCHRTRDADGVDTVYPVNALAFHKGFGTFATGGCDGCVCIWDGQNKKRIAQLPRYPTSVAALAFNDPGTLLAVASSYTFEEGEKTPPPLDQIFVREVNELEVRPKARH